MSVIQRKPSKKSDAELSQEELKALKDKANVIMANARRQVLYKEPFIGQIAMQLDMIPVRDRRCDTACTDGQVIYFDIAFLESLSVQEQQAVIAHEVWHNVMLHFLRAETRERYLFNIATDMEVNQILKKDGFTLPEDLMWPKDKKNGWDFPYDLNAEAYYELLQEKEEKEEKQQNGQGQGQGQNEDGDADGNEGEGEGENSGNDEKDGNQSNGHKSTKGKFTGQFDKHIYQDDDNAKDESGQGQSDKYGKIGDDPDFRPMQSASAGEKIREAAVAAAQEIQRQKGDLPDHLKRIIGELLEPEIPWRARLAQFITRSFSGDRRTWNRPSRRYAWSGTYLPSHDGEKVKLAVGIDTSGSCQGDLQKFLSEVKGIVTAFGDYQIDIIQCDYEVQAHETYDMDNPLDDEKFDKFESQGGGGTAMMPIFDFIKEKEIETDALVIFTDGYIDRMSENPIPDLPVLWVLTKDGSEDEIGFGEKIKFKA